MKRIIIIGLFRFAVNFAFAQEQPTTPASYQEPLTKKDLIGTWSVENLVQRCGTITPGELPPKYYTFVENGDFFGRVNNNINASGTWYFAESNQLTLSINDTIRVYEVRLYDEGKLLLLNEWPKLKLSKVTRQP